MLLLSSSIGGDRPGQGLFLNRLDGHENLLQPFELLFPSLTLAAEAVSPILVNIAGVLFYGMSSWLHGTNIKSLILRFHENFLGIYFQKGERGDRKKPQRLLSVQFSCFLNSITF